MTSPPRIPFPALALALCLLFAAIGITVVDDYGISNDEMVQRESASTTPTTSRATAISCPITSIDSTVRSLSCRC